MCSTNLKWWRRGIAGTNSSNLLCFLQVKIGKTSIGRNQAVNNEEGCFGTISGYSQEHLAEEDEKISGRT